MGSLFSRTLWTLFFCIAFLAPCAAGGTAKQAHEKLQFLVGDWNTESVWPTSGEKAPGRLRYEWVLDGAWMKVTFIGKHPSRPVWEAHGMIHYLPETERYESIIFAGPGEPIRMYGFWRDEKTLRFETEHDGVKSGIDYTAKGNGVYQENWRQNADGTTEILLKTTYTPNASGK